ncbi:MAG: hypothetical protein AAGJ87_07430, partial [Pseudomonadota bacterium]
KETTAVQLLFGEPRPGAVEAEQQLDRGRFLAQSIDYRDVMGEAMTKFLGAPQSQLGEIFPDHSFSDQGVFAGAGS